jgi:hypothetical protein
MRNILVVVLTLAILGIFGVAQAASDMPAILGSIETNAYEPMSDEEMDAVAGELQFGIADLFGTTVVLPLFYNGSGSPFIPSGQPIVLTPGSFVVPFFYYIQ